MPKEPSGRTFTGTPACSMSRGSLKAKVVIMHSTVPAMMLEMSLLPMGVTFTSAMFTPFLPRNAVAKTCAACFTPSLRPTTCFGEVMPLSLRQVMAVGAVWNWPAMTFRGAPLSTAATTDSAAVMPSCAMPEDTICTWSMPLPPGMSFTSRPASLK